MNNQYKVRTITCQGCGVVVTKRMSKKIHYCSLKCYRESKRPQRYTGKEIKCSICNSIFYIPKNRIGKAAYNFCSIPCMHIHQGRNKDNYICKICGKEFKWSPSRKIDNKPTYCSLDCRNKDPERTQMLINMNRNQQKMKQSSIEKIGYSILDNIGIEYSKQTILFDKFCVDAFIPEFNIVIQFDGDYWHFNPVKFQTPDKRQSNRINLDKSQDAYFTKCGFYVLRIWEYHIRKNTNLLKNILHKFLITNKQIPITDSTNHLII
jgi:very-short-patch-repair endonuclease